MTTPTTPPTCNPVQTDQHTDRTATEILASLVVDTDRRENQFGWSELEEPA